MLGDRKKTKLIYWSFLCIYIIAFLLELPKANINISASNFFILLYISIICLVVFYAKTTWKKDLPPGVLPIFNLLLLCNLIAFIRGMFFATKYFEWKIILTDGSGGLSFFIPLAMLVGLNICYGHKLLRLSINILLYSFLLVPLFINYSNEIYARLVTPVVFLIMLTPYYKFKQQLIIYIVAFASAAIALTWRANVLHIGLSLSILAIYYFRSLISKRVLFALQILIFALPFYFLVLGINGKSIFAKNEDKGVMVSSKNGDEDLTADTRTNMYEEVLGDLYKTDDIWLGRGSNGKYKTQYDWELVEDFGDERGNVEVGFLKTLMYTGILGIVIYAIILLMAVYYGTNHTSNTLTKMLATFLACHWVVMFMENMPDYNIYFYFSWVAVGVCFSKKFRALTDSQIKEWLRYSR